MVDNCFINCVHINYTLMFYTLSAKSRCTAIPQSMKDKIILIDTAIPQSMQDKITLMDAAIPQSMQDNITPIDDLQEVYLQKYTNTAINSMKEQTMYNMHNF